MIKITNGSDVIEVTSGAFKSIYSGIGFVPVKEEPAGVNGGDVAPANVEDDPDKVFINEVSEKPIGSWTKAEIKRFASLNDIDLKGVKEDEAREFIAALLAGKI